MFTGIIEELGTVVALDRRNDSAVLRLSATTITGDLIHGASIAVNGVCLTVVGWDAGSGELTIDFDVMGETLQRSVVGGLAPGDSVNLERAVKADARLDGHVVQGHVDGTGVVLSRTPAEAWESVRFGLPADLARFVAEKGSIAVDGVSLTVSAVGTDTEGGAPIRHFFDVGLIPETLRATTLGRQTAGRPGQPRGRRAREVRRPTAWRRRS